MTFELAAPNDDRSAIVDGPYRYELRRVWDPELPALAVVMLNPSTADAEQDDPTIRRVIAFARREGYGGIIVLNLYAYRATDPDDLRAFTLAGGDPHGENGDHLANLRDRPVLVAWGAGIRGDTRHAYQVANTLTWNGCSLVCLGTTRDGHPRHPLYVRGDTPLETWVP